MSEQNEAQKQEAGACGPGCSCGGKGSGSRGRWIAGVAILLIAGALVVKAVVKNNGAPAAPAPTGYASLSAPEQPPAPDAAAKPSGPDALQEIATFSELNSLATNMSGVFVFMPGKGEAAAKAPTAQITGAIRTMEPQLDGGKIGFFSLKAGSRDYEQIAAKMEVPGVLAMVKGGGMAPVSGEITETKLVEAFVAASRAGGACGPSGCGPSAAGCE